MSQAEAYVIVLIEDIRNCFMNGSTPYINNDKRDERTHYFNVVSRHSEMLCEQHNEQNLDNVCVKARSQFIIPLHHTTITHRR